MKGYKGFSKGLICRGKQYAENTVFEEDNAKICHSGMHFCKNPFDVLEHYGFVNENTAELNEFCEVEALDEAKTDDEKKFCTKKLKIGAKLGISGLINAFVSFTLANVKSEGAATNTGDRSAATNTGDRSAATNTGDRSAATNTGYKSAATVSGKESFAIATGIDGKAKGTLGCYIALAEWEWNDDEKRYRLMNFKTHKVDGETIKPDTFYMLKEGEFVEVEDKP
ncbi:MAG: hypothetical protein K1W18_11530 [Oscillospiraceae bacterium]